MNNIIYKMYKIIIYKYHNVNNINMEGSSMDYIDREILKIFQEDGRITMIDLSKRLHLSRPSVNERVRRLQEQGIIDGFTARIDPSSVGRSILVIIQIANLKIKCHAFEEIIKKEEDILECHRVTGTDSYFMKAAMTSMKTLENFVDRLVPYGQINTSVVLSSPVTHNILLPEMGG